MNSPASPSAPPEQYDVFLSHNSRDKDAVERIARRLQDEQITAWLDKWDLTPGRSSIQGIEDGLMASRSCVIFYGPAGIGPWHELERHAALVKSVNSRGEFPVIPVLLPGVKEPAKATLPPLLQDVTWVEFNSIDPIAETAFQLLLCGIRGVKPREFFLRQRVAMPTSEQPELIVPHGLRSFTERDSRFFLRLLPGARDHRGLPESIAFWKDKLEEVDPERTFAVGLLHGPSGCGKSSLVKAGLLPRLAECVRPIYLEATAADTEQQLLSKLRKLVPDLPGDLLAAFQTIRERLQSLGGCKVVVILDQFEQWLHANPIKETTPLVQALKQCDGRVLQAVLMVRADVYILSERFMTTVGRTSQNEVNALVVDLFKREHAREVLVEFGRAHKASFSNPNEPSPEEVEFLNRVLDELQDKDGMLIAVQLALFSKMVEGEPWTGEVLKNLGGVTGVGRVFLERSFDAKTATPSHKLHRAAAIAVLKLLMPPRGADLKGTSQLRSALATASGYQNKSADFDALIVILTTELRLISLVAEDDGNDDPIESATVSDPMFQLTHDYLVPSLREWLTAGVVRSMRGRAQLVLEERAEQWLRDEQPRNYPSIPECLRIGTLVRHRQMSDGQQRMMRRARNYYLRRSLLLLLLLPLLIAPKFVWDFCTFQVEFADLAYEQQRAEMVITRKWDPRAKEWRFRFGTHIFKDERGNLDTENKINQRLTLNVGLSPDWTALVPLLSDERVGLAEIEWLDRSISTPSAFISVRDQFAVTHSVFSDFENSKPKQRFEMTQVVRREIIGERDQFDGTRISSERIVVQEPVVLSQRVGERDQFVGARLLKRAMSFREPDHVAWGRVAPAVVDAMITLLRDTDRVVRYRAAESLVQFGNTDPAVIDALVNLPKDQDSFTRDRLVASLRKLGKLGKSTPAVIDALVTSLKDQDIYVRGTAALSLEQLGKSNRAVIDVLNTLLKDRDSFVRSYAAGSLVRLGNTDAAVIDTFVMLLKDPDSDVRLSAAASLVRLGRTDSAVIETLVMLLKNQNRDICFYAAALLVRLGNSDSTVIDKLVILLEDPDSNVRYCAAAALVRLGNRDSEVIDTLVMFLKDPNSDVRYRAAAVLVPLGNSDPAVVDTLVMLLREKESDVPYHAAAALVWLGNRSPAVVTTLVMELKNQNSDVRYYLADSLGQIGKSDQEVVEALVTLLKDQDSLVRCTAATSLVRLGTSNQAVIDVLLALLKDQDSDVCSRAAESLAKLGKSVPSVIDALVALLKNEDSYVRFCAAAALGETGKSDQAVIDALIKLLKDQGRHVRCNAAESLAVLENSAPMVIDALVSLLKDQDNVLRQSAANAIGVLGQKRDDWTDERMISDFADFDSGVRERSGIVLAYRDDKLQPETRQKVETLRKDSRPWVRQASLHALYHIEKRKAELAGLAELARMEAEFEAANAK